MGFELMQNLTFPDKSSNPYRDQSGVKSVNRLLRRLILASCASQNFAKVLTVAMAIEALTRLGGYLEHRRKTPIGIQVLWRGWLKLASLCEGWQLATQT